MMTGVVEELPQADNRVSLLQRADRWGVPLAQVAHSCAEESIALWESARAQGLRVMQAGGAVEAWTGNIGPMHNMGGTMMGRDTASSVTNSYGQCHDVPNLLIAGASLFPTGGAVNPTFTIHALAARGMHHLLYNWSDIAIPA
jgi:choline dehydrogenase-like flavoprotein